MSAGEKKTLLITTALFICLSVFCSFLFIAEFSGHDCTHDDECAVCHAVTLCISTIRGTAGDTAAFDIVCAAVITAAYVLLFASAESNNDTLISLKVELRN